MNEIRKKQRRLYKIMKALIIFSAVFIFVYIGAQPYVSDFNSTVALIISYFCDALVVAVLVFVFLYYSRYGKCDSLLTYAENEINDYGYYISPVKYGTASDFIKSHTDRLFQNGFSVTNNVEITDFTFDIKAKRGNDYIYTVNITNADGNDVLAYLDEIITDITIRNVKRRGNAVLNIVTDTAQDSAIALSKMITPLGKKEKIKIAICIYEAETGNMYFQGAQPTKCQALIVNYIMGMQTPIPDEFIHKDRLSFQYELEKKMKAFTIADFKSGKFYLH